MSASIVHIGVFLQEKQNEKAKKKIYLSDQVKFWINTRHQFNPHTYSTCLHLYFGSFISLSSGSQFSLTCSIVPGMKLYPNILYLFLSEFNRRVRTFRVFKALRTEWTLGGVFLYRKKNWFICTGATWKTFVKYSNFFPRQIASHNSSGRILGLPKTDVELVSWANKIPRQYESRQQQRRRQTSLRHVRCTNSYCVSVIADSIMIRQFI